MAKVATHSRYPSRDRRGCEAVRAHRRDPGLDLVRGGVSDGAPGVGAERREVARIRVDGARRPAGLEGEQEALDVGVGSSHGARADSAGSGRLLRAVVAVTAALAVLGVAPGVASASQLIARNTSTERLAVSADGKALLTYHAQGKRQRVLVWGAINARQPTQGRKATEFRVDYSGGWGTFRRQLWKTMRNVCRPYRRPGAPVPRHRVHRARRVTLGDPALAPAPGELRPSALEGGARGVGATRLALERAAAEARGLSRLELRRTLAPPVRPADLPRPPRPRLLDHAHGRSARSLRARPLPRHLRLGVRQTLVPGERVRRAAARRDVLLRVRPSHRPHGRAATSRPRRALPPVGLRARRHARRRVGGRRARELQRREPEARRARDADERAPALAHGGLEPLPHLSASCADATGRRRGAGGGRRRGCRSGWSRATRARGAPG